MCPIAHYVKGNLYIFVMFNRSISILASKLLAWGGGYSVKHKQNWAGRVWEHQHSRAIRRGIFHVPASALTKRITATSARYLGLTWVNVDLLLGRSLSQGIRPRNCSHTKRGWQQSPKHSRSTCRMQNWQGTQKNKMVARCKEQLDRLSTAEGGTSTNCTTFALVLSADYQQAKLIPCWGGQSPQLANTYLACDQIIALCLWNCWPQWW